MGSPEHLAIDDFKLATHLEHRNRPVFEAVVFTEGNIVEKFLDKTLSQEDPDLLSQDLLYIEEYRLTLLIFEISTDTSKFLNKKQHLYSGIVTLEAFTR